MDTQYLIVALILFVAVIYSCNLVRNKLAALRPKKNGSCAADCGCGKASDNI